MLNLSKKGFQFLFVFIFAGLSLAFAEPIQIKVDQAKRVGAFELAVGSEISLISRDSKLSGSSVFLGSAVQPDGIKTFQVYLNKRDEKVYFIDRKRFSSDEKMQTILNPYEQAGGTCSGYALYGFMHQTRMAGFVGNGELNKQLSTEKGRTTLLVDNINRYYLTPQHQFSIQGILNKYGQRFGFSCKTYKYETYQGARKRVLEHLQTGFPVVVSFNVGPNMYPSPFEMEIYQSDEAVDQRLWIPRRKGERNSGGHAIVAAAAFEFNNKTYMVMIDSDWNEPRVWDMDEFIGHEKTALNEVEFTVCK